MARMGQERAAGQEIIRVRACGIPLVFEAHSQVRSVVSDVVV